MDPIRSSRILTRILTVIGLWPWTGPIQFEHAYRVYSVLLHLGTSLLLTVLMWLFAAFSPDMNQATDVLYIVFTESALLVKISMNFRYKHAVSQLLHTWQTDRTYWPASDEEQRMWQRAHKSFGIVSNVYIMSSLYVVGVACVPLLWRRDAYIPFEYWVPFDWQTPARRFAVLAFDIVAMFVTCQSNITMDMLYCYMLLHMSLLFRLIGMRLERLRNSVEQQGAEKTYSDLVEIISLHQQVKRCVITCDRCLSYPLLAQIMLSALILCFSVYRLQYISHTDNPSTFFNAVQFALVMVSQIYLPCYYANDITVQSDALTDCIFNSEWPDMPAKCQQAIQIVMSNAQKPAIIRAGGFFNVGLPIFSKTINNAYSFFALLINMDN